MAASGSGGRFFLRCGRSRFWKGVFVRFCLVSIYAEPYTISVETDDGARVWLNDQLIIDDRVDAPISETTATMNFVAGQNYLLRRGQEFHDGGIHKTARR